MPSTAIVASQILDSGLTGRQLVQSATKSEAITVLGLDPSNYALLDSNNTFTGRNTFDDDVTVNAFLSAGSAEFSSATINDDFFANNAEFSGSVEFTDLITGVGGEHQGDLRITDADLIVSGSGKIDAVDGDFSGTLTTEYIKGLQGSSSAGVWLRDTTYFGYLVSDSNGGSCLRWGGADLLSFKNIMPQFGTLTIGRDNARWQNYYGLDGSFSGNLNVESGGSQRLYDLGTEGDTDTRYIEVSDYGVRQVTTGAASSAVWVLGSDAIGAGIEFSNNGLSMMLESSYGQNIKVAQGYSSFGQQVFPRLDNTYPLGIATNRWSNVASVDGDFSGKLNAPIINDPTNTFIGLRIVDSEKFTVTSSYVRSWVDFIPTYDGTIELGRSNSRWEKTWSVDGSFSGNLVSEVGGSYKLYNLGTEGDTDTEYLETLTESNAYYFRASETGNGIVRSIYLDGQSVRFTTGGNAKLSVLSTGTFCYTPILPNTNGSVSSGTSSNRWANTYSIDGDFSGTVTVGTGTSGRVNFADNNTYLWRNGNSLYLGASGLTILGIGAAGSNKAIHFNIIENQDIDFKVGYNGGTGINMDGATGNVTFGADTIVNSGGSQRLYNLGTEGDADTEYLETSFDSNILKMFTYATGTGVRRNLEFGNADNQVNVKGAGDQIAIRTGGATVFAFNAGSIDSYQNLMPSFGDSVNLGTSTRRWSQIYVDQGRFKSVRTAVDTETAATVTMNRATDHTKLCDCTSNNITVNLDTANPGIQYVIKKVDSTANTVTITGNGSETIDGAASQILYAQDESITIASNGSGWYIVSEFASPTGGNPFNQSLNTTDSPTFVDGDFSGTVTVDRISEQPRRFEGQQV